MAAPLARTEFASPDLPKVVISEDFHDDPAAFTSDLDRCIGLALAPSVHSYHTLRSRLEFSSQTWIQGFLERGGLEAFVDTLVLFSGKGFTNFTDAVLQLDCVSCVRATLNSPPGLQFIVRRPHLVHRLVKAADTPNALPKKQVFEILSGIAAYSPEGHRATLDGLDHFKRATLQPGRFSVLVTELRLSEAATYRTTLLGLINVLINSVDDIRERGRIRDEFLGLQILDVLTLVRRDERDADLALQCQIFAERQHMDEELVSHVQGPSHLSPDQLFRALSQRTYCTPQAISFLHTLQDMYLLDTTSPDRFLLWSTLAKTTHHIASLKDQSECSELLQKLQCLLTDPAESARRRPVVTSSPEPEAPLLRAPRGVTAAPAPAPQVELPQEMIPSSKVKALSGSVGGKAERRDSGISVGSCSSPVLDSLGRQRKGVPDTLVVFQRQGSGRGSLGRREPALARVEEEADVVKPSRPVKVVKWTKVDPVTASRPSSIWKRIRQDVIRKALTVDYEALEQDFRDIYGQEVKDADDEIQLLPAEHSMAINLFLIRAEMSPEELSSCILEGEDTELGLEAIRILHRILPSDAEISQLRDFKGERFDLGPAEQFLLLLAVNADYRVIMDALLLQTEFTHKLPQLRSGVQSLIATCRDVIGCDGLRYFLRVMLMAGNFLNSTSHLGVASGVRLESWRRVLEVKGNHHHDNLLTVVIKQLEGTDTGLLTFVNDLSSLENAAKQSLEDMKNDVTSLNNQLKRLLERLSMASCKTRNLFDAFIRDVKKSLHEIQKGIGILREVSQQMALYFCEDPDAFDLQKCLNDLFVFVDAIKQARKDGVYLRQTQELAAQKMTYLNKKNEEEKVTKLFGQNADMCSSFVAGPREPLLDRIIDDIHRGRIKDRRHGNHEAGLLAATPAPPGGAMRDDQALLASCIPRMASTPARGLDTNHVMHHVTAQDSYILETVPEASKPPRTYADRVETVIGTQYHRERQVASASFIEQDEKQAAQKEMCSTPIREMEEALGIKFYPKIGTPLPPAPAEARGHRRSNSDMGTAKRAKHEAPPSGVDSSNVVTSLDLERGGGQSLSSKDLYGEEKHEKLVRDVGGENKNRKRASFGLLKRISRALRQKNGHGDQKAETAAGDHGKDSAVPDGNSADQVADKRVTAAKGGKRCERLNRRDKENRPSLG